MSSLAKLGELGSTFTASTINADQLGARFPNFIGTGNYGGLIMSNLLSETTAGDDLNVDLVFTDIEGDIIDAGNITDFVTLYLTIKTSQSTAQDTGILIRVIDDDGDIVTATDAYTRVEKNANFPSASDEPDSGFRILVPVLDEELVIHFKLTLSTDPDRGLGFLAGTLEYSQCAGTLAATDPGFYAFGIDAFANVEMDDGTILRGFNISYDTPADIGDTTIISKLIAH